MVVIDVMGVGASSLWGRSYRKSPLRPSGQGQSGKGLDKRVDSQSQEQGQGQKELGFSPSEVLMKSALK